MHKSLILTVLCLTLASCASLPDNATSGNSKIKLFSNEKESITGKYTTYTLSVHENNINWGIHSTQDLSISYISNEDGSKSYYLVLYYKGTYWWYIENLLIKVDEKLYTLKPTDTSRTVGSSMSGSVNVHERLYYDIDEDLFKAFLNATQISIQYHIDLIHITDIRVKALKDFLKISLSHKYGDDIVL